MNKDQLRNRRRGEQPKRKIKYDTFVFDCKTSIITLLFSIELFLIYLIVFYP